VLARVTLALFRLEFQREVDFLFAFLLVMVSTLLSKSSFFFFLFFFSGFLLLLTRSKRKKKNFTEFEKGEKLKILTLLFA
jgi:hypothetical protein